MSKSDSKQRKHLPKRSSSATLKARRARSWARGAKRKAERKAEAEKAQRRNAETVAAGGLTPWQQAKAERRARRNGGE